MSASFFQFKYQRPLTPISDMDLIVFAKDRAAQITAVVALITYG
jgi:hypothetical protein